MNVVDRGAGLLQTPEPAARDGAGAAMPGPGTAPMAGRFPAPVIAEPVIAEPIMTQPLIPQPPRQTGSDELRPEGAGGLLARVFHLLDRDGLPYCVLHGYQTYFKEVPSDVDLLVPREMVPRHLAELLHGNQAMLGARLVQWFNDRAHFVVLAGRSENGAPVLLQLHVGTDYDLKNRVIYRGSEVLAARRTAPAGFWVPSAAIEFGAVLANKLVKRKLGDSAARRLGELWASDPIRCSEQAARLLGGGGVEMVCAAAGRDAWGAVRGQLPRLRREMLLRLTARRPIGYLTRLIGQNAHRIGRWLNPQSGLHVVFLGPDGAGKSTVIDAVRQQVAPAFLHSRYQTFARGILPTKPKASPHALPPRSLAGSAVKAMWWCLCYTAGYYAAIYPTLARGGLMINHRYLLDALVDPRRYRYSGPARWIRSIWKIAPKPDLLIFLDAPAEVIHQRKQEVKLEEAKRQRDEYRALAGTLPDAHLVDTSQSIEQTVAQVTEIILAHMAARVGRQMRTR